MTIYKCDLCLSEILEKKTTIHIGRQLLGGIALCPECGKPALDFLESVEQKIKIRKGVV